ncbi:MAG: hypothetical protein Q3997_04300 [Propionibacteriaceae bacterium]|nr:hypothetical protein [Propionibacteriaceae bacterium]
MSGPLRRVLAAFEEGAATLDDVARISGLDKPMVDAAVAQLSRMGRLEVRELRMGCPGCGCSGCASGHRDGSPGCGASAPSSAGPVLVQLSLRREPR